MTKILKRRYLSYKIKEFSKGKIPKQFEDWKQERELLRKNIAILC